MRLAAQYGLVKIEEEKPDPGPYWYVWEWFLQLHTRRAFDGASGLSQAISWEAIKAWGDVTETPLATHEIRLLSAIDDFFIREERKAKAKADKETQQKNKNKARR